MPRVSTAPRGDSPVCRIGAPGRWLAAECRRFGGKGIGPLGSGAAPGDLPGDDRSARARSRPMKPADGSGGRGGRGVRRQSGAAPVSGRAPPSSPRGRVAADRQLSAATRPLHRRPGLTLQDQRRRLHSVSRGYRSSCLEWRFPCGVSRFRFALRRPRSTAKRPERGPGYACPLLVSYLGLKAWRRDAAPTIFGVQALVANFGNDSLNEPRSDCRGSLLSPDVVIRCDVHMSPSATHRLSAVATGEVPISVFDVAVVVKFRVVGYPKPHSSPDHTR